jgi:nucleotide-binding universal stress UspA family protein
MPRRLERVLVAVNGSPLDAEVVALSIHLARRDKAKVFVIYVIEVRRTLPLEAALDEEVVRGERILDNAEAVAESLGYQVETELLQAREAGPTIVDEAESRNVDMIVLGLPYKKRFGEFNIGRTVPYVLKNATCQVVLWREPLERAGR